MTIRTHRLLPAVLLTAGAVVLTACGSAASSGAGTSAVAASGGATGSAAASGSAGAGTPGQVTVTVTDAAGCVATPDTVPAGQVTFVITNQDAVGVTEVELVADQRIVGERENLAPGFDSTFSARLDGGSYEIYCPGASTERSAFTVTGQAGAQDADLAALLTQSTKDYATYVDDQITFLLVPVQEMAAAIKAGDLAGAQAAYIKARPFYERIEPVAESFPDLDPAIDLRIGDVEQGTEWTGFHPIEQGLWEKQSTDGLSGLADGLVANVQKLQQEATKLSDATTAGTDGGYQAFEIANGSATLLDEVLASKITGEEEAYSRIDLLDFEANVEGSLQAFATLKPALDQIDPTIVPQISAAFDALTTELATFRDPASPSGWVTYDKLTDADKKALTDALLAVQEPLSAIAQKITQ
ncbi:iron uptake system protein EfeO [Nakamurella sp.]|uniref:iron uptake system protein EfeO n=1 Tax=Nakamurella sp. TaxID=1869182 RepID=UPI003B3A365F